VVVPVARASPYVARYAEPDKLGSGLAGVAAEDWAVPYWLVDASFVTMQLLLLVESVGLGALFHRLHNDPAPWLAAIGAPDDCLVIGAVTLGVPLGPPLAGDDRGVPAASPDLRSPDEGVRHRSPLRRARSWRTAAERIHRSTW
jgi:nitroreductase